MSPGPVRTWPSRCLSFFWLGYVEHGLGKGQLSDAMMVGLNEYHLVDGRLLRLACVVDFNSCEGVFPFLV
jgi:hypothetical protein